MAAEVTVVFRDDEWQLDEFSAETYESWLTARLEEVAGINVMSVDIEEV